MNLIDQFLNYISHEKRYSAHTIRAYVDDITSFQGFIGNNKDANLLVATSNDVRMWLLELAGTNLSPRTYRRKLSSIKAFYKFLLKEKLIKNVPTEAIIIPKFQNPLPEFYSSTETINLFDNIVFQSDFTGKRDKLIFHMFYLTGIRLSELINLRISDIDFSLKQISVTGKRNKQRNIPISKSTIELMEEYLSIRGELMEYSNNDFFIVREKGEKMYPRLIQRLAQKYFSQVTTSEKTNPHKLRHTFATHMLNNGADLNAVKELLGHASLAATEVYTHNTYEKLKSVYKQAHPRA